VAAAIQPGYGTSLIRELIPHELGGTVDLVFAAEGTNCRIEGTLKNSHLDWPVRVSSVMR
jgi:two-component sensor histidine kinase